MTYHLNTGDHSDELERNLTFNDRSSSCDSFDEECRKVPLSCHPHKDDLEAQAILLILLLIDLHLWLIIRHTVGGSSCT